MRGTAAMRAVAVVVACAITVATAPACAAALPSPEARIKAGIVYNLALAVSWPDSAPKSGAFVIGLVGQDASDPELSHLAGKQVRRRELSLVEQLASPAAGTAQIVYVSRSEQTRLPDLLRSLARRPLLTVSEIDGFCEAGGMVQLRRDRNRIQLLVNLRAAERAGLRFNSQLLKVAEIVEGGD